MTHQGDDKPRQDPANANAGILKKRKPRSLDEEAPLDTKPPWVEPPGARLSAPRPAVPPPPPPASPRPTLGQDAPRGPSALDAPRRSLGQDAPTPRHTPQLGPRPAPEAPYSRALKPAPKPALDEELLEAFVYDDDTPRSSEPPSGAPLRPRRPVGSSLFGEASASWRKSAQQPAASPAQQARAHEPAQDVLRLEDPSSLGGPVGFLSDDEDEPLDLLDREASKEHRAPPPPARGGRSAPRDHDDLFGGGGEDDFRLDDDEVPFSDDPYVPSKPNIPKPSSRSAAREDSLFDFSQNGYSLDPHDELSLPSDDALDLDAPMPPPRGASPKPSPSLGRGSLDFDDPEDRFGAPEDRLGHEDDIYDLDLPSELPPKKPAKAAPHARGASLDDSFGEVSDLPPVKTEREEHDVSRIYQEEELDLDPMYTQDLEPPRPSGPREQVVGVEQLQALVERAVEARAKDAPTAPRAGPSLLPLDWGKAEEKPSQGAAQERGARLDFFLRLMRRKGARDLHLHAGHKPALRQDDKLVELPFRPLSPEDWARILRPITPPAAWLAFSQHNDADFLYEAGELGRVRVNLSRHRQGPAAVLQSIPETARSLGDLGLPPQVERLASLHEGLCLLLGPSGSGVSTTAAALLEHLNQSSAKHIITIEDPIEYVFEAHKSVVQQREVGVHAHTHAAALRAALRERPDVVFLSEISDTEVLSQALEAAAMGTLVLAVVPSRSLGEALERLESFVPDKDLDVARVGLADSLSAVLCQRLLPRASGGKVPAVGLYLPDLALRKALREGEREALAPLLAAAPSPSLPLDHHLAELHASGAIGREAALDAALDPDDLAQRLA